MQYFRKQDKLCLPTGDAEGEIWEIGLGFIAAKRVERVVGGGTGRYFYTCRQKIYKNTQGTDCVALIVIIIIITVHIYVSEKEIIKKEH